MYKGNVIYTGEKIMLNNHGILHGVHSTLILVLMYHSRHITLIVESSQHLLGLFTDRTQIH